MSQRIYFHGETGRCQILIDDSMSQLSACLAGQEIIIITDDNVNRLYNQLFPPARDIIILQSGEGTKLCLPLNQSIDNCCVSLPTDLPSFWELAAVWLAILPALLLQPL